MNDFVKFWSKKRLSNKHIKGCILLIALVVAPVVCALILSDSMIQAMSNKFIYLSSGHLCVNTSKIEDFSSYPDIKYANSICSGYAMMYSQDQNTTLYIKGVDSDYFNDDRLSNIRFIAEDTINSSNLRGIIISNYTAKLLNLNVGDKTAMMIVPDVVGKAMRPVIVRVSKIYTTGYEAIDSNLAFIDFDYASTLFEGPDSIKCELILHSDKQIDKVRDEILKNYDVNSWMSSNYAVFSNFVTSKQVIFIILLIVVVIAGFYTSSAARLANEDCIKDISILKMIGASDKYIYYSSLITMMIATILGIIFGVLFGLIISFNFSPVLKLISKSGIEALSFYLIDFSPVVSWRSIMICIMVLLLISFVSVSSVLRRTRKITPIQLFNGF